MEQNVQYAQQTFEDKAFDIKSCPKEYRLAINDALNVFTGKWKLQVIVALVSGKRRFNEIEKNIPGISPKMLTKELRDLEINGIVTRNVMNTVPPSVEYELTPSGYAMRNMFDAMINWGLQHRQSAIAVKAGS